MALAHATDAAATLRAVRAALSKVPDPLLIDAASDADGLDTGSRVNSAKLEAMEDEAVRLFGGLMQGR